MMNSTLSYKSPFRHWQYMQPLMVHNLDLHHVILTILKVFEIQVFEYNCSITAIAKHIPNCCCRRGYVLEVEENLFFNLGINIQFL